METVSELINAAQQLDSREGTIDFLEKQTFLSPERIERIRDVGGGGWIYYDPENPGPGWDDFMAAAKRETKTKDGVNIATALNASAEMLQMDIEEWEGKGETPAPMSTVIKDHLKEKALLSGESLETVYNVYSAELARCQRLFQLIGQIHVLKAKEENDQKGG